MAGRKRDLSEDYLRERMRLRYDLARRVVPLVLAILSLWIPLQGVLPIAEALAGKHTALTVSFSISILISAGSLSGVLAMWFRLKEQRKEILRLRLRAEKLEAGGALSKVKGG